MRIYCVGDKVRITKPWGSVAGGIPVGATATVVKYYDGKGSYINIRWDEGTVPDFYLMGTTYEADHFEPVGGPW